MSSETFMEISAADFFYRNRDLAGFSNPSRAIYSALRELIENSLDACELYKIPPQIFVRLSNEGNGEQPIYRLKVADNGSGIPKEYIPQAFGRVLFGSKYILKQVRGTFGLGGKMAILYGQITTHSSARIISSTGKKGINEYEIMIDITENQPKILTENTLQNNDGWHGTIVEFTLEGDYTRAMSKILEYMKQTAIATPYANLTFIDPRGRLYKFDKATIKMPNPPKETKPHPYGCDVETLQRIIRITNCTNMLRFMIKHFHRVGKNIAKKFLKHANIKTKIDPKKLEAEEIVKLTQAMKNFEGFLPPDAGCLSPLGEELLEEGIKKELNPEFVAVKQRNPSTYSGYPFIVEAAIAYGGDIPNTQGITLYRFANRIPLLYDEASDVTRKVINSMINWRHYKVSPDMPTAVIVHICSTKIPYKTVGKEFIADRPEVEKEILNSVREVARQLRRFLTRKIRVERQRKRQQIFARYLPKIAQFSTKLAGKRKTPNIEPLLKKLE